MSAMIWSAVLALVAMAAGAYSETANLNFPPLVKFLLHEIGEAGKFGLALLVAVNVIREVLEHQLKQAGGSLSETKSAIETTLTRMSTSVDDGLGQPSVKIEAGLRELKFDGHLDRSWSPQEADQTLCQSVPAQAAVSSSAPAKSTADEQVAEALLSSDPALWRKAEELLPQLNNPEYYLRLAYKFWSVDRVDEGLKLAEAGLAVSDDTPGISAQLKNNLAYFYAERNRVDKKGEAFQYIREAREGVKMCARAAFAKGNDQILNRWLERYEARTF